MARNVYYDPFGAYTGGIQAGIRDGMGLERGVRDAQVMDYDFNTLQPLRTQGLQREENFQQYFDPMRREVSQYGVDRARFATGREAIDSAGIPFKLTGNAQPAISALNDYYGIVGAPDGQAMDWLDFNNPAPEGGMLPGSRDPNYMGSISDYYFRPEAMQQAEFDRQLSMDDVARQNAATQAQYAMMRELYRINQGADPAGNSWIE